MEGETLDLPVRDAPTTAGFSTPFATQDETLGAGAHVGRYLVVEPIGRGGMGIVYAAYDPRLDRKVALKMVRAGRAGPEHFDRLVKEAQALAKLSSPNVVVVHEVGEEGGRYFIAMEFVQGTTLAEWLRRKPDYRAVLKAFAQAGQGLADAHRAGIVHRDFKPSNVLVEETDRVKVCDFGLARVDADNAPLSGGPASIIGTRRYMSPELVQGARADTRSDVYAFAVSVAEALCDVDVDASHEAGLEAALRRATWARGVPNPVRSALRRAVASDPAGRYPEMEPLLRDLQPGRERRRALAALGAIVGVAGVATGVWAWQARRSACLSAGDAVVRTWGPEAKRLVREAFSGPAKPAYLAPLADGVVRRLDAYAAEVSAGLVETCRASIIRKDLRRSEADARRDCLMGRAAELGSLATHLRDADLDTLDSAPFTVGGLSSVEECSDPRRIALTGVAPGDPARRDAVHAVREELVDATEQTLTGHYEEAAAQARRAADDAKAVAFRPAQAEAERRLGMIDVRLGRYDDAEAALREAVVDADVARDDLLRATAATDLVGLSDTAQRKLEQGLEWAAVAQAAIDRAGGDESREAALENHVGNLLVRLGRYDDSARAYERSLEIRRRLGEEDEIPGTLNNEALVLWNKGDLRSALDLVQRAETSFAAIFGAEHPTFANMLENEASLWLELGRPDKSLPAINRVAEIRERALPETHPERAETFMSIGETLAAMGDLAGADRSLRHSLEMLQRIGSEARAMAEYRRELGVNEHRMGNWRSSEEQLRAALTPYEATSETNHPEYVKTLLQLAALEVDAGRPKDAEMDADRARHSLEGEKENESDLSFAWSVRAEARLALGDRAGGRAGFARAVETLSPKSAEYPVALAIAKLRLAATELAIGAGGGDLEEVARAAIESVSDLTNVEATFARAYARAVGGEWANAAHAAPRDSKVADALKDMQKVAFVDRRAVFEVEAWVRGK